MITSEKSNNHEMAYEDYVNGQIIFYGSYLLTADEIIEYGKQWDPFNSISRWEIPNGKNRNKNNGAQKNGSRYRRVR